MFKLWLEWDYGQDGYVFNTEADAKNWMRSNMDLDDFDPPFANVEEIFDAGLASVEHVTVWRG